MTGINLIIWGNEEIKIQLDDYGVSQFMPRYKLTWSCPNPYSNGYMMLYAPIWHYEYDKMLVELRKSVLDEKQAQANALEFAIHYLED